MSRVGNMNTKKEESRQRYSSVLEMMRALSDAEFVKEFEEHLAAKEKE